MTTDAGTAIKYLRPPAAFAFFICGGMTASLIIYSPDHRGWAYSALAGALMGIAYFLATWRPGGDSG